MGVTITRSAMLSHCRALTAACSYTEGEVIVCVLDFKVKKIKQEGKKRLANCPVLTD